MEGERDEEMDGGRERPDGCRRKRGMKRWVEGEKDRTGVGGREGWLMSSG